MLQRTSSGQFDTVNHNFGSAKLSIGAYARDYDDSGDNEEGKGSIDILGHDFTLQVEVILTMVDE